MKLQPCARALFWLATLTVVVLSLMPVQYLPDKGPFNFWDKAQHALAFGALTTLGLFGWPAKAWRLRLAGALLWLGGAIEMAQYLTGWRYGEWADWAADAVGIGVIYAAWGLFLGDETGRESLTPSTHQPAVGPATAPPPRQEKAVPSAGVTLAPRAPRKGHRCP